MVSSNSRSSSRGASQPASRSSSRTPAPSATAVAAALKNFCEQLKLAKKKGKEIKIADETLDPVNNILGQRRGNYTPFQPLIIADIVFDLDDNGDDVCSRLEAKVYSILLRLFLQTIDCPEVERGLYLLAATLFDDAHFTAKEQVIAAKKIAIGEYSLQPLLNFFTKTTYPVPLRRLAGILLLQLLQDSEKNVDRVMLGSDNSRCKLGNMVLTESNEVVKIICGQLIRVLVDAGTAREYLWPEDTNTQVYEGFPDSSQPGRWNQRFQTYLDDLERLGEVDTPQNADALIYFAQDVDTIPFYNLERLGHTTYIAMNVESLSIWSPASDTQFDQFLEVPLQHITGITISTKEDSQPTDVARVAIDIENDVEQLCSLNGVGVDLNQALMHLRTTEAISFRQDLFHHRPEIDDRSPQEAAYDNRQPLSQNSVRSSSSNEAIVQVSSRRHARFESAAERSAKGKAETKKKLRQSVDPDTDAQLESSEDFSKPEQPMDIDDCLKSRKSQTKGTKIVEPNATTKKRGAPERQLGVKTPLSKSQKAHGLVGANDRTGSKKTRPPGKSANSDSQRTQPAGQTFEQKVEKLSQDFPAESSPTIRGVLIVAEGDLEAATEALRKGSQSGISSDERRPSVVRGQSSSRLDKIGEQFNSSSLTSPDENDASTPNFNRSTTSQKTTEATAGKLTAKVAATSQQTKRNQVSKSQNSNTKSANPKPPKYSLKAKQPLSCPKPTVLSAKSQERPKIATTSTKAQEKLNSANGASSRSQEKPKAPNMPSARSQVKLKAANSDLYELPDDEDDGKTAVTSKKGTKGAKKAPVAPKTAPKTARNNTKKRQSAPAALETTAAATRSRRSAAVAASQKLRDSTPVEDEIEDEEELLDVKGTASQNNSKPIPKDTLRDENPIPAPYPDNQENPLNNGIDLGPLDGLQSDPGLYNASPKQSTKKPTQEPLRDRTQNFVGASKTVSQAAQNFSAKLGDMLGGIDDELVLDQADLGKPEHQRVNKAALEAESDNVKKRKALSEVETPPKRRRSQGDKTQAKNDQALRRSPRLKARVEEEQRDTKQPSRKVERKATSPPARSSPRLKARVQAAVEVSGKPLIDEHMTRKVHIVNFGAQGANNQGPSSVLRSSAQKNTISPSEQQTAPEDNAVAYKSKRTRDDDLSESKADRPSKRQSISPDESHEDVPMDDGNLQDYSSSPLRRPQKKRRSAKTSSQASRVDYNGSPRPLGSAEIVDHISKVTQKLLQQKKNENGQSLDPNVAFAPRVRLASIPKTGPSSPIGVEARYVKHQKMGNGVYEGIESKEVVAPEKSLADPFVGGPACRSSDFADRLQAGASKENRKSEPVHQLKKSSQILVDNREPNVSNKVSTQRISKLDKQERNSKVPKKAVRVPIYDDQPTLVNSEPDLTCGSSEDDTRTPLSEKAANRSWNVPFRPHYETLADVTHRLADEVIIRLANEEEAMEMLVHQYKTNGDKHLNTMIGKRGKEKGQISNNLSDKKQEMVAAYAEAKKFVNDSEKILKSSSLLKFENQWRKEQEVIQRRIDEGRKMLH